MQYEYFIKFTDKRQIRLLLRHNCIAKVDNSSVYEIGSNAYILLKSSRELVINKYLRLTILTSNELSSTEAYVYQWSLSETSKIDGYIKYESDSNLKDNARVIKIDNIEIRRLFAPLADIFAILNYTLNSFSDGGQYNMIDRALTRIMTHLDNGARIIDLGVESTRPNAKVLTSDEEISILKDVLPEVLSVKQIHKFELSIDSYHEKTVKWLLDLNVDIINDVSGRLPLLLVKEILSSNKRYVAMHSLSIPADSGVTIPLEHNPTEAVKEWMLTKIARIDELACSLDGLILDPGIGFGKNAAQSWHIVRNLEKFRVLPCELLLGHSRKSMFRHISNQPWAELDLETAILAGQSLSAVDYLRLHDLESFNRIKPLF